MPAVREIQVKSLGQEDSLEIPLQNSLEMYLSTLAGEIPWTEEPGGLQSWGCKGSDVTEQLNDRHGVSVSVLPYSEGRGGLGKERAGVRGEVGKDAWVSSLEARSQPLGHCPEAQASVSSIRAEFPHPKTVLQIPRQWTQPPAGWGLLASTILSFLQQASKVLPLGHDLFSTFCCARSAITTFAMETGSSAKKGSPQGLCKGKMEKDSMNLKA